MSRYAVLLACTVSVLAAPARAQEAVRADENYAVTAWSQEAGLPAPLDTVLAMAQDREGYLWLGTRSGLIRFDGSQFFSWGARGEAPLAGRSVRSVSSSKDGGLWITFSDADGVTHIRDHRLVAYSERDGLPGGVMATVLEDRGGTVWAGGPSGLARFTGERWERVGAPAGLPEAEVYSLHEDKSGHLWVGTSAGVFRRSVDGATTFEAIDRSLTYAYSFAESGSGGMWVTDSRQIVHPLNGSQAPDYAPGLPSPAAGWRLVADRRGGVWIAALGNGLLRVRDNPLTGKPILEPFAGGRIRGSVQTVYRDRSDNLWVGLRDGLVRLSESFVATDLPLEGLTDEGVRALAVTPEGSVWAATTYGLNRFSGERRRVYSPKQTMALHADRMGRLWVATMEGINRLDGDRLVRIASERLDLTLSITTDRSGDLWLCSGIKGVHRLRLGRFARDLDIAQRPCSTVATDSRGTLWIGFSTGGVAGNDGSGWRWYGERDGLVAGRVNAILEDKHGALWMNAAAGVSRFENGRFTTVSVRNGLPDKLERSMVHDNEDHIWLAVNGGSGIIRFSRREVDSVAADPAHQLRYVQYDQSDGVPSILPFWSPAAVRGGDGRLWFATGAGVAVIDATKLPLGKSAVTPRIENVVADGVPIAPGPSLELPKDTSTLQIDYAALSLTAGTKLRFRYRLEGTDAGWVYAGLRRQAHFTNLQPGAYTFRVTASSDGLWNEREAVWAFSLPPPFYRTMWFYSLSATATASVIWAYWWLSLRAVRNKYALVLAERARVSREIHDTLLQSLGAVGIELEVVASHLNASPGVEGATSLQRLRKQVQQCVTDARQSIWELRAPGLEARDLVEALNDLVESTNWASSVEITVTSTGRAKRCSPQAQEQLLRIAREAISNAVRHGRAERIELNVLYRRRSVSIRVSDNGRGFAPESVPHSSTHCGLASMKERAERLGGHLKVASRTGAGAIVEAVVPLS